MHSIAPYTIRCYDSQSEEKNPRDKYHVLSRIGGIDLYDLLKEFVTNLSQQYRLDETSKQAYKTDGVVFDDDKREISFWFLVGYYGMRSDIINIETFQREFAKGEMNADIMNYFTHFYIPRGVDEGMAFMHKVRSKGKKTLFMDKFLAFFKSRIDRNLSLRPLSYQKAFDEWKDAQSKEIKVTKFVGHADILELAVGLGHVEQEMIVKPQKKGKSLGTLASFFEKNSPQNVVVEALSGFGKKVTTVVELDGKQRTFTVGRSSSSLLCEIELGDDVDMDEGVPNFESIRAWVKEICAEYNKDMYF